MRRLAERGGDRIGEIAIPGRGQQLRLRDAVDDRPRAGIDREQQQQQARRDEEHHRTEEEARQDHGARLARDLHARRAGRARAGLQAPVEVAGDLLDLGLEHRCLMQDLRIELAAERADVERAHEASVVDTREARERRELALGGEREESIGPNRQRAAQPRDVRDAAALHVRRRDHDLGRTGTDPREQALDVIGRVAQIDVERDDVIAAAVAEAELERLSETEIHGMMEHAHLRVRESESVRQRARSDRCCRH